MCGKQKRNMAFFAKKSHTESHKFVLTPSPSLEGCRASSPAEDLARGIVDTPGITNGIVNDCAFPKAPPLRLAGDNPRPPSRPLPMPEAYLLGSSSVSLTNAHT